MAQPTTAEGPSIAALIAICCMITFAFYFAVSIRLPVVPLHAKGFGVTTAQIGLINAAFYLMAGLLAIPAGALSDIFGRKRLVMGGGVLMCAGMLLLCFSRTYLQFAAVYLLLGIGIAAFGPTMMSWVAEIAPPTHLGRAYGWYTTALFCGLGLGPAAGGIIGARLGFAPVFLIGAALIAIDIWALARLLPMRPRPPELTTPRLRWSGTMGQAMANRPLIGCWSAALGANIIAGVFFTFLPLLAHHRGLSVGEIGVVFLVQSVTNALSRIPIGALSDRFGHRGRQAMAGVVLVTLSIMGFAPAAAFFHFLLAAVALGISLAVAFTAIGALIAETAAPGIRGLAMGGYNSAIYFGLMAGSMGIGPLIETAGFGQGFFLAGIANIPFVALYAWGMRGYEGRPDGRSNR